MSIVAIPSKLFSTVGKGYALCSNEARGTVNRNADIPEGFAVVNAASPTIKGRMVDLMPSAATTVYEFVFSALVAQDAAITHLQ